MTCEAYAFLLLIGLLVMSQVSEAELEAIARMGDGAAAMEEEMLGAGGEATRQLLGQYGQTPAK
jgi:pre-mRNA-splicing factor CDC5/CEF1